MGMFNVMAGGYLGLKHGGSRKFSVFGAVSLLSVFIGFVFGFFGLLYAVCITNPHMFLPGWLLWIPAAMIAVPWAAFWVVFIVTLAKDTLADAKASSKRNGIKKYRYY